MIEFEHIRDTAINLCGSEQALAARLPQCKLISQLNAIPDSEYLSVMSRRVFRAGLRHSMVDAKWPAFEQVFHAFDPDTVRFMSDDDLDALMQDARIIRHFRKIQSVRANAQVFFELAEEHGSFATWLSAWPADDCVGLWLQLKKRFNQLGGQSGPYFLRMVGKDTFLFTDHVVRALNRWGVASGPVKNTKDRLFAQQQFHFWQQETGLPLCQISVILANSID